MRKRRFVLPSLLSLLLLSILGSLVLSPTLPAVAEDSPAMQAAKGELKVPTTNTPAGQKKFPSLSGGLVESAREALQGETANASGAAPAAPAAPGGVTQHTLGCSDRNPNGNVRVNQDCTYRRQAEELIKVNPLNARNLIAGQNDSRVGFNKCGFDYSFNGGRTWGDGLPPFYQRLNSPPAGHTIAGGAGTHHTYDAASDPGLAFDAIGNAYFSCTVFDVNTDASGVLVSASPNFAGGSFYENVPATGSTYVAVEDNSPHVLHDKPFITADSNPASPRANSVYLTWTVFFFDQRCVSPANPAGQCESPIYFSRSTDQARTWSAPKLISGNNPSLCFFGNIFDPQADPNDCNMSQGSDPIVRPNGDVVVIFNNGNTPADDPNAQQLGVTSHDGGDTWSSPTLVGRDIVEGEPQCDFGRGPEECIPGPFIRTNDFPRIAVNRVTGDLFGAWQDYRTGEYDIQLAQSMDGGTTWHVADNPANPDSGMDHYMPATDVVAQRTPRDGDQVGVSYFRSERVPGESDRQIFKVGEPGVGTSLSDYFLAGGRALVTPFADVRIARPFPAPDGIQAGFNGDYSGMALAGRVAHPIWSDTRNQAPASEGVSHDEDVFTDAINLPDGHGQHSD